MDQIEEIRRVFREAIEGVRRDVGAVQQQIAAHVAVCDDRHLLAERQKIEQERRDREQSEAVRNVKLDINKAYIRVLWQVITWNVVLLLVLIIGWVKMAGGIVELK